MTPDQRAHFDGHLIAEIAHPRASLKILKQMVSALYARSGVPRETFESEFASLVKEALPAEVEHVVQKVSPELGRSFLDDVLGPDQP